MNLVEVSTMKTVEKLDRFSNNKPRLCCCCINTNPVFWMLIECIHVVSSLEEIRHAVGLRSWFQYCRLLHDFLWYTIIFYYIITVSNALNWFTQVLHHLEEKPDGVHFDGAMKTLQEVHRVLKPGGLISITAPTPTQMRGWWFLCLHEDTLCRFLKRFMSASQLRDMLVTLGFEVLHIIGIFGHELYASYSDLEWPLKPSFRQDVSYFSQATPEEQKEMIAFMEQMRNDGELQQFYETHDKSNEIGQFILCVVRRI